MFRCQRRQHSELGRCRFLITLLTRGFSVEEVLKMCGLERLADAQIGSLGMEKQKRVTIGVELAAKVFLC